MIPFNKVTHFKTSAFVNLLKEDISPSKILIVGCGNGTEILTFSKIFPQSQVYGIDLDSEYYSERNYVREAGNAENLKYKDEEFDLIYTFHVLEHISNPQKALTEMKRVLKKGGYLLIGTPNRSRLVGYISSDTTLREKINWNITDWKAMMAGKFKNELGAHAGFSHDELREMLCKNFSEVRSVSKQYYEEIYSAKKGGVKLLYTLGLNRFLLPAVYFIAKK